VEISQRVNVHKKKFGLNWYVHYDKAVENNFTVHLVELSHYGTKKTLYFGFRAAIAIATYESCVNTFGFMLEQVTDINVMDILTQY